MEILKHINISLIDNTHKIPNFSKFMKDVINKTKHVGEFSILDSRLQSAGAWKNSSKNKGFKKLHDTL